MFWDSKKVVLTGESGNVYTLDILAKKGKTKLKGTVKLGAVVTTPKPTPPSGTPKPTVTGKPPGSGSGETSGTGSGIPPGSGNPSVGGQAMGSSCSCVATKISGGVPGPKPGSETGSGSEKSDEN
eukprot:TRINITY_DN6192_c0_g1_i2.p1 TRINITY_DN6192_c0_g1~~TRINITY_DN6192_c0_g1_i2.p1  ORF type:complete len:125 (-),score=46.49 TRINITY_DN6192_c0_g1_i2:169-543(-)